MSSYVELYDQVGLRVGARVGGWLFDKEVMCSNPVLVSSAVECAVPGTENWSSPTTNKLYQFHYKFWNVAFKHLSHQ